MLILLSGPRAGVAAASEGLTAPGVTGTLEDGEAITIAYDGSNGFGSDGPTIVLFDTFAGKANGAAITTNNPEVGTYTSVGGQGGDKFSTAFSRHGSSSMMLYDGSQPGAELSILRSSFAGDQIARVRYWMYVPTGKALPDCSIGGYSFAASSFKIAWLGSSIGTVGSDGPDICLPTAVGGTAMSIAGNNDGDNIDWLSGENGFGGWNGNFRYGEWWLSEHLIDCVNGINRHRFLMSSLGYRAFNRTGVANPWGSVASGEREWSACNLVGYVRGDGYPDCELYFQDYSIATGSGAWADVFIGNASTLAACTDLRHVRVTSWSNTSITCTLRTGLADLDGWYIFVRKSDNNLASYSGSEGRLIS